MIRRKAKKETLDEPPLKKQKIDESCDDCVYRGSSASLRILFDEYCTEYCDNPSRIVDDAIRDYLEHKLKNVLQVCRTGNLKLIKSMVENGFSLRSKSKCGETCLLVACEEGNLELVTFLIENGSSTNERDNTGSTSLLIASTKGF